MNFFSLQTSIKQNFFNYKLRYIKDFRSSNFDIIKIFIPLTSIKSGFNPVFAFLQHHFYPLVLKISRQPRRKYYCSFNSVRQCFFQFNLNIAHIMGITCF